LFLCTSNYESFGLYYLELLASGAVGVFLDKPWVRALLPGYRYVAKKDDLLGMLKHVREHHAEAKQYIQENVLPFIRATYTIDRFAGELFKNLREIEQ
jgi:hypothetical protein